MTIKYSPLICVGFIKYAC